MSHSKMLQTRRRKQKASKQRARVAKRAKKLQKQGAQTTGAGTPKAGPA